MGPFACGLWGTLIWGSLLCVLAKLILPLSFPTQYKGSV